MSADKKLNSTEKELQESLKKIVEGYTPIYEKLERKLNKLEKVHEDFPVSYMQDTAYEDYVLKAAHYKHESIVILKESLSMSGSCKTDYEYLESQLKIYSADTFLREKFDKVTDGLRNSFVKSKPEMRTLAKLQKRFEAQSTTIERLVKAFEADEVNFRRFHQMNLNLKGI